MALQEMIWRVMNWIYLAQVRYNWWAVCECGNEHSGSIKYGEFLDWLRTG